MFCFHYQNDNSRTAAELHCEDEESEWKCMYKPVDEVVRSLLTIGT